MSPFVLLRNQWRHQQRLARWIVLRCSSNWSISTHVFGRGRDAEEPKCQAVQIGTDTWTFRQVPESVPDSWSRPVDCLARAFLREMDTMGASELSLGRVCDARYGARVVDNTQYGRNPVVRSQLALGSDLDATVMRRLASCQTTPRTSLVFDQYLSMWPMCRTTRQR